MEEALPLERKFLDCGKGPDSILNDTIAAVELVVDKSHTVTSVSDRKCGINWIKLCVLFLL